MVALLVVFAGLLQIGALNLLHTNAMTQARSDAANRMLSGPGTLDAHYIRDITPGPDERRYTRDDDFTQASAADLQGHVLGYACAQQYGLQEARPNNAFGNMDANPTPQNAFDMVHGQQTYPTNLFPIVRDLIYSINNSDYIDVHVHVFMTGIWGLP